MEPQRASVTNIIFNRGSQDTSLSLLILRKCACQTFWVKTQIKNFESSVNMPHFQIQVMLQNESHLKCCFDMTCHMTLLEDDIFKGYYMKTIHNIILWE